MAATRATSAVASVHVKRRSNYVPPFFRHENLLGSKSISRGVRSEVGGGQVAPLLPPPPWRRHCLSGPWQHVIEISSTLGMSKKSPYLTYKSCGIFWRHGVLITLFLGWESIFWLNVRGVVKGAERVRPLGVFGPSRAEDPRGP